MLSPEEAPGGANSSLLLPLLPLLGECALNATGAGAGAWPEGAGLCAATLPASAPAPSAAAPPPWSATTTAAGAAGAGAAAAGGGRRARTHPLMAWWQQLAWTALFALMLVVAIGGNAIVMWIVLAHRRMRTVTNYFLVNLSVADLFMAIFNCIFNFVYMINNDWFFGRPYCTVSNFIANVSVAASVFTLTGISVDRYLAIVRPLKPRMSKLCAQATIGVIWAASLSLGCPCLLYSNTITYRSSGKVRTVCILVWPDGQSMKSTMDYVYNVVLFLVTYVVPMGAMVGCYTAMGRELWGSRSIGELTQRQVDSIRSKRKVVRMFIVIVLIFAVCWLPYHAYFIYIHHHRAVTYSRYVQHLYLAFYWLAMANSMVNPLIYYWMNARFRQYFKDAVCRWRCPRKKTPLSGQETPPMFRHYSHSYSRSRSGTADEGSLEPHTSRPLHSACCCTERHHRPMLARMAQRANAPARANGQLLHAASANDQYQWRRAAAAAAAQRHYATTFIATAQV